MKRNLFKIASLLALGVASTAFAATQDGAVGTTESIGTADITLTIPKLIRITGMDPVQFGNYSAGGDTMSVTDEVCVYGNFDPTDTYRVTAHGSGTSNAFTLTREGSGTAHALPYHVYYNSTVGAAVGTEFSSPTTPITAQSGFTNTYYESDACAGHETAQYTVEIMKADILAAKYGTYNGTLTLIVEPEPVS